MMQTQRTVLSTCGPYWIGLHIFWKDSCSNTELVTMEAFDLKCHHNVIISYHFTSSTAQGGGGSFKNRKPVGEVGCCESRMAERIHWWTERWLRSPLFLSLSLSLTVYLPTYLPTYLSIYRSIDLSIYIYLSLLHLITYLSICLSVYLSVYLSILSYLIFLSIDRSMYLSIHPSIYLSIHLSISLCLSVYLSICKLENKAILRDCLSFETWQHQKQSNSARLPSKMESWVQSWQPRANAFCDFSTSPV